MAGQNQIFREFLETYNRIVDECFNRCVYTFNYRYLRDDEIDCISHCTSKYANFNQRMNIQFAEIQFKKMADSQTAIEGQQQQELLSTMNNPIDTNSKPS